MTDSLAHALAAAARTGPVQVALGRGTATDAIAVSGAHVTRYLRVGSAPADGDRVIVLRTGSRHIVFTGVTAVN